MKKQFLFAALAVATLFTACSKEEELNQNNGTTPVNFVIGGVGSRTATTDAFVASFEADDEVGIFSTGLKDTQITNGQYKVINSNNIYSLQPVATGDFYFNNDADATFYAYYPYAESATNSEVTLTVKNDQNVSAEADNFNCNDLLVATQTVNAGTATADGVALKFDHVMSFVELTFGDNLLAIGVSEVAMTIASPTITYDFTSTENTKYTVSGVETSITMYSKGDNKFWAIVPPQTIKSGITLFTITADNGRTYTYTVGTDAEETFASNTIRKIKLDVASTEDTETSEVFKISSISINGWGNADSVTEEDVKDVEEVKLNVTATLPTYDTTDGATNAITTLSNGRSDLTEAGWGAYSVTSANLVKDETNGNYIKVVGNATVGTWNNQGLYYWAGEESLMQPSLSYILTFAAMSESSGQISVMVMKKSDNIVFPIVDVTSVSDVENATASGTINSKTLTSSWTTYKFKIIPNKTMTGGWSNLNNAADNTASSDICIAIKGNSSSSEYMIKNVTFEQM